MQDSNAPTKIPKIWAQSVSAPYINAIPIPSQQSVRNGAASLTDGFPPLCFVPIATGGAGPFGADFNGIFNQITAGLQWSQAGGPSYYDASFSSSIGGYPLGAIVPSQTRIGVLWQSTVDNNTTNPDSNSAANWISLIPQVLTAPLNIYVATTGSDTMNTGLTSGSPFATLQRAWNYLQQGYDLNGFTATINVANGTYTTGVACSGMPLGAVATNTQTGDPNNAITFLGNPASPSSCIISVSNANCFTAQAGANFVVNGFKLQATGVPLSSYVNLGSGLYAFAGGGIVFKNMDFGACNIHIYVGNLGFISSNGNPYTVSGNAVGHVNCAQCSYMTPTNSAVTFLSTPAFSGPFVVSQMSSSILATGMSFVGTFVGSRYSAVSNGVINTGTANVNYFPGTAAGSTASGGQYL
jgi:hypothetical protein